MSIGVGNPVEGIQTPTTIAFGPVPSRRLGSSLGINNIPHKVCTYSCVYCQVGRTLDFRLEPSEFYKPEAVAKVVAEKITKARDLNAAVDYLTFVPDGEPTLDQNIINLRFEKGISVKKISQISGYSVDAIYKRVSRIYGALRQCVNGTLIQWEQG